MRARVRGSALVAVAALLAIFVAYRGFAPQILGDYQTEAAPAMNALLAGHLHAFVALQPPYGGSLLLRAPISLLAKALGGGQLAIFRAGAFVCVLSCGLLGAWLANRIRNLGRPLAAWLPVVLICALAPLFTDAITQGHPEEALGAALCVTAVLLAAGGRPLLSGLALGLAIVTKQWGVLAAVPALLAVPAEPSSTRARMGLLAIGAALPVAQLLFTQAETTGSGGALVSGAQNAAFAHAFDLWWPFAHATRHLAVGSPPVWIVDWSPPALIAAHAHELIVLMVLPLAGLVVRRHGWFPSIETCLGLLALLFLVRCALDPQDLLYYHLPCLIALTAWESFARRRTPWVSIGTALALYLVFEHVTPANAHTWADFVAYVLVVVPLAGYLLVQLAGHRAGRRALMAPAAVAAAARP